MVDGELLPQKKMGKHRVPPASLHPVVDVFVNTDRPIADILRSVPEPRSPTVQAMLLLVDCQMNARSPDKTRNAAMAVSWDDARKAAEAVPTEVEDPNLYLHFLIYWAAAAIQAGQLDEAEALLKRARALVVQATPVVLLVLLMETEGVLAAHRGDKAGRERISAECLKVLPHESPRYLRMLISHAIFLAQLGRESEIDAELDQSGYRDPVSALPRFFQAMETGRLEDAAHQLSTVPADRAGEGLSSSTTGYKEWMDLMVGRWAPGRPLAKTDQTGLPSWTLPMDRLVFGQKKLALEAARGEAARFPQMHIAGIGPNSYDMVRAELANGGGEAARRLMEQRWAAGNRRYLDDLFMARIELLAGDREAAARHFAAILGACDRYQAHGRLDFELRMALELSASELARLASAAGALSGRNRMAPSTDQSERPGVRAVPVGLGRLVGKSRALDSIRETISRYAPIEAPVLITGETGTGKELVARAIHEEGPRAGKPFIAVNCGAITESLLESELFGHERGAFTGAARAHRGIFEEAGRGTILLDEIGDIPPRLQVALLRVLESGEIRPVGGNRPRRVSCRIVAATNADLGTLAGQGRFREDLLYRLRRLELRIPPLRERREDIVVLVEHFLNEGRADGLRAELTAELKEAMRSCPWPGNVRELRNCVERMRLLNSDKRSYGIEDLEAQEPVKPPAEEAAALPPVEQKNGPPTPATDGGVERCAPLRGHDEIRGYLDTQSTALRRLERLRAIFANHPRLNRKETAKIMGVSLVTATRDLQALCREGLIEKVTPSASPRSHHFKLKAGSGRG
jgi:DNA-binding NtrC family response regulator